ALSHLHSFPTRRSSDLTASWAQIGALVTRSASRICSQPWPRGGISFEFRLWKSDMSWATAVMFIVGCERTSCWTVKLPSVLAKRSEEHTSELQSQSNLV